LADLERPQESYERLLKKESNSFGAKQHLENLRLITADPSAFPKPSQIYNAVIVATYNESYDVLAPTIKSV